MRGKVERDKLERERERRECGSVGECRKGKLEREAVRGKVERDKLERERRREAV